MVIANRLETLKLAMEVMDHPYSSKHVTHLLWDGSWYEQELAHDFHKYEHRFAHSSHAAISRDEEYIRAREADAAQLLELAGAENRETLHSQQRRRRSRYVDTNIHSWYPHQREQLVDNALSFEDMPSPHWLAAPMIWTLT